MLIRSAEYAVHARLHRYQGPNMIGEAYVCWAVEGLEKDSANKMKG